jgi:hypothetical protein
MTLHIILTDAQANQARMRVDAGHVIAPRKMFGQGWALPIEVLSDPAFVQFQAFLSTLPTADLTGTASNWGSNATSFNSSTWPIGQLITI